MDKILTIIIPTYNMERYLHKSLKSLIVDDKQLMDSLEVLVINDGSKDRSSQIAHEYEERYSSTFKVIDKENGNYGSCVNSGLKEATGKFVKILDADDSFDTNVFQKFLSQLQNVNADLVITDFCIVDENGNRKNEQSFDLPQNTSLTFKDIPLNKLVLLWHHGITYKTSILHDMHYRQTEGISYTDDEWVFMPMIHIEDIVYFPGIMYLYLRGREGQTFDPKVVAKSQKMFLAVARSMSDFLETHKSGLSGNAMYFLKNKYIHRVKKFYSNYLIYGCTNSSNAAMAEFDKYLEQKDPFVYQIVGEFESKQGVKFVKAWRKGNYRRNSLMLLYQRLLHKLDRLKIKLFGTK